MVEEVAQIQSVRDQRAKEALAYAESSGCSFADAARHIGIDVQDIYDYRHRDKLKLGLVVHKKETLTPKQRLDKMEQYMAEHQCTATEACKKLGFNYRTVISSRARHKTPDVVQEVQKVEKIEQEVKPKQVPTVMNFHIPEPVKKKPVTILIGDPDEIKELLALSGGQS